MKSVVHKKYRYHMTGASSLTVRGLTLYPDSYVYSDVPIFSAADLSAHIAIIEETDLGEIGTWILAAGTRGAPINPTSLAGVIGESHVVASWVDNSNMDVASYEVGVSPSVAGQPFTVLPGVQTKNITGMTDGTAYTITVKSVDKAGAKSTGVSVVKTPLDSTPPADVTRVNAQRSVVLGTEAFLSWVDSVSVDVDHVEITHDQAGGATPVSVAVGAQLKIETGLTVNTTYTFTIKAVDSIGNKSPGVTVKVTPVADTTPPANVTGAAGTNGALSSVLTWVDPVDEDLDHLEVTWDNGGTAIQKVACGALGYTATGLTALTLYTFTIKSVDKAGNKSAGATCTATPTA